MKTYKERLEAGLLALGWSRAGRTGKYHVWSRGGERKAFVGQAGALRVGRVVSESHSAGCPSGFQSPFWHQVIAAGDKALNPGLQMLGQLDPAAKVKALHALGISAADLPSDTLQRLGVLA